MSLGLVLIPCVNALACQRVGNVELSDVAGVFLALSLSLALCVYALACQSVCNVEFFGSRWRFFWHYHYHWHYVYMQKAWILFMVMPVHFL